ncbi:hypothetical protein HDU83_003069 [Entophlyctis luteolus]|nr:hypothetical protein HDU82_000264 [Entophlyctis luteolus]KAJ3346456.1 hypothetical protein HDU83_003069 [Entophlyctis luteolus]KAJ3385372.1 hypothetical protein HDU84_002269 [Entophlyctis sp. JEL0112]
MDSLNSRLPPAMATPAPHETEPLHAADSRTATSPTESSSTANTKAERFKKMANNVGGNITKGVSKTLTATMGVGEAFVTFINRGSVVDLAVGVVMGSAFTAIVTSFVNDLITPIIGLIGQKNLGNLFLVMHCSPTSTVCRTGGTGPYATVALANTDGAATWNYGNFIQAVINFILVAGCMFLLVQLYSNLFLKKKPAPPKMKTCAVCAADDCPIAALKCKWCLADFEPVDVDAVTVAPAAEKNFITKMFHK